MRADCQNNHERRPMYLDHPNRVWRCDECGETISPEDITRQVLPVYLTSEARQLMNYEIVGLMLPDKSVLVEYERRGR